MCFCGLVLFMSLQAKTGFLPPCQGLRTTWICAFDVSFAVFVTFHSLGNAYFAFHFLGNAYVVAKRNMLAQGAIATKHLGPFSSRAGIVFLKQERCFCRF